MPHGRRTAFGGTGTLACADVAALRMPHSQEWLCHMTAARALRSRRIDGGSHSARVAGAVCGSVHITELGFRHAAVGDRKHRQECLCHKASRKRGAVCSKKMILSGPEIWGIKFLGRGVHTQQRYLAHPPKADRSR